MDNEIGEILKILIENPEDSFSIRKLSLMRRINYKSAHNAIKNLEKQGLIQVKRMGNNAQCSFSKKFNPLVFSVEFERRQDILNDKDLKIIHSRIYEARFPFIALLFGSYVKNTKAKYSDIDMLFIVPDKSQEREIMSILSLIPLKIHPTIISYSEFISMLKSKEFSVVSEAIKKNIILVGIEEYYRFLKNAQ